jgi:NADP-dependent 3-hydroxy acid dehydrogenase YdfG
MKGPVTIVGAGPGVGAAVARRFGREGHPVALVARNRDRLEAMVGELETDGMQAAAASADVRRPAELRHALADLAARLGLAEILCFSPLADVSLIKPVLDTTAHDLGAALELQVVGAAAAVAEVLPPMRERGRGTLLFTTGSAALTPSPERANLRGDLRRRERLRADAARSASTSPPRWPSISGSNTCAARSR